MMIEIIVYLILGLVCLLVTAIAAVGIYFKAKEGKCYSKARLVGKLAIVTGASSGIGIETARDLAARGARVILACRNVQKAQRVADDIKRSTGSSEVKVMELDVASLPSVRQFSKAVHDKEKEVHILVNNAGIGFTENDLLTFTDEGLELIMASNHYGHFLLTNLLGDLLKAGAPSRIVNVSSLLHTFVKEFGTDDLNFKSGKEYSNGAAYGRSKLCNVLMSRHLAKKLAGTGVTTYSLQPGLVTTNIFLAGGVRAYLTRIMAALIGKNVVTGAQTSIYCAVEESLHAESGLHYADCKAVKPSKFGQDDRLAEQLWLASYQDVKLTADEARI